MAGPGVKSVRLRVPRGGAGASGEKPCGPAEITVTLDDGSRLRVFAATPQAPAASTQPPGGCGYRFGPLVFVEGLDEAVVSRAVSAMAAEMGGYWLRYYHCAMAPPPAPRGRRRRRP